MLKRLWQWLKRLIQQLFGRKQTISPPLAPQVTGEIRKQLTDKEYESLFLQLLAGVNEEGWSRGRVKGFLDAHRINQANLVEWLRGFGERLLASATENNELAARMVQLGELSVGEVSDVAYDIGRQLLRREEETNRRGAEDAEGSKKEEAIKQVDVAGESITDEAEACFNQGVVLVNLGLYELAIASYDNALKIKPDDHETWNNRGVALYDLGQFEEAIVSYDNALKFKPDFYQVWNNRGLALANLEQYEQEIASYDNALKIEPDDHEAWNNRGIALRNLGQFEEAISSYDKALKIKPDKHIAWNNRGVALYELGQFEEAIASYDKALTIKLDKHITWNNRGIAAGNSVSCNYLLASSSVIARQNPHLNQRGYEGKLATYEEGLKYCHQDTHPQGWGKLHQAIGNAHYFQAQRDSHPRSYWYKAIKSYNEALKTLTAEDFPELHLEVLQDLIQVQLELRETTKAEELQRRGTDGLRRLLDECKSPGKKKQLTLKFAGFQQFTVDLAVQSGNWCAALELAEQGKNACLSWLLDGWSDNSPKWVEMKQLLNSNTAIVYWHLSPAALHTFIFKHNTPSPIVLGETLLSPAQRLRDFETWVKNWNEEYANYRKGKDKQSEDAKTWRDKLPKMLNELDKILDINAVISQISDITQLILIPHRDLHRFPLHALFPLEFTISYLPSARFGIKLQKLRQTNLGKIHELPLLSVEYPNSKDLPQLPHAVLESAVITQLFNNPKTQQISGEKATNTAVKASLKAGYNVFHFTGHSTYNFYNPKKSALALSSEDFLTLEEICNIENLSTYQLVSLSSCETAITGNQTITAEYAGLVSAFLSQSVTDVVSSLWSVTDEASSFLMIYFYWQLKKGKSPVVALNQATKWLRNLTFRKLERIYRVIFAKLPSDETVIRPFIRRKLNQMNAMEVSSKKQKHFEHPYYWADFIITGGLN
ncbi:hypothetical protein BV378_04915 [Nostoc sp. RF31YmG]|nr:hypothetical protein BV378_04915 [Nostoc sp. RF31YmG]